MTYAAIHPNWDRAPAHILEGYSLEMTAKERPALEDAWPLIAPETPIAIPFLPTETIDERVAAALAIRDHGFEPMPHLSARRIISKEELSTMMARLAAEAGVRRALIVAGDPPIPAGPFEDTMQLLQSGVFDQNGLAAVGIGGHPEGHPTVDDDTLWRFMKMKIAEIERRGMAPLIVTQFGFDPDIFLRWLSELRDRGVEAPVRIGVPGPTNIKRLLRYAKFCGVDASAAVFKKYGVSLGRLIGSAGPDKLVDALREGLGPEHGRVRIHFYPFGGLTPTMEWIKSYVQRRGGALPRYAETEG
jgi:methylenetetrahydrofolate reductase (NADPH)